MSKLEPQSRPARSRQDIEYLPEPVYFFERPDFPKLFAARITARCVLSFGTRYLASPVGHPAHVRKGRLPAEQPNVSS